MAKTGQHLDGAPAMVWLEEPHHGVQLGVQTDGNRAHVPLRGPAGTRPALDL